MDLKKEIKLSDLVRRSGKPKQQRTKTATANGANGHDRRGRARHKKHEVVGLKIGASQLAASRVVNNGGAPKLLQLAREPLGPGIVSRGEVRDVQELAAALDRFFTKHALPRRDVRLGVATNRIGVRAFELAGVDDERQLANAVRFRAHEALSIPIDAAVLDYQVVGQSVDSSGVLNRRIVLTAAYRDSIDRFVDACKQADIRLVGIDLEAFALLRALAEPSRANGDGAETPAALIALTVGHDRSTLAISDGTVCDFTRVLDWGGARLNDAIQRALHVDDAEAEDIKLTLSLDDGGADDATAAAAGDAVRRELQTLSREVVASLHFYQSQPNSLAIGEILIAGGTSRMPGLAEELERLTHVRVRRADPLVRVVTTTEVAPGDDLPSLAVAIGLGVED